MTEKKVPCEVYSRIVGFLRPIQSWNIGKQQEWKDRVTFDREAMLSHPLVKDVEPTPVVVVETT